MTHSGKSERVYCNQCRGKTVHRLLKTADDVGRDDETDFQWHTTFEMLQCAGCQEVVLRRTFAFSENQEVEVRYFPPAMSRYLPKWRHSLPNSMRLLLEEVYRSLDSENLRLPMMGARTLVDMLFFEQLKKDVGSFKQKLEALEKKGIVSPKNREVLDAALDAGSAAALMLGFLPVFAVLLLGRPRTGLTEGSFPNPNSALACSNSSIRRLISAVRDASDTVDKSTSVICPPSKSFCINTAKALYAQVRLDALYEVYQRIARKRLSQHWNI